MEDDLTENEFTNLFPGLSKLLQEGIVFNDEYLRNMHRRGELSKDGFEEIISQPDEKSRLATYNKIERNSRKSKTLAQHKNAIMRILSTAENPAETNVNLSSIEQNTHFKKPSKDESTFKIHIISLMEAMSLVKRKLNISGKDKDKVIWKLLSIIESSYLSLDQAICYILEQKQLEKCPIQEYITDFKKVKQNLIQFCPEDFLDDSFITTMTTCRMALDQIGKHPGYGDMSVLIFEILSYINPENIEANIFSRLPALFPSTGQIDKVKVMNAIGLLVKYGIISKKSDQDDVFTIHKLVQQVSRCFLSVIDGKDKDTLEIVLRLLQGEQVSSFPIKNLDHALVAWRHVLKFPDLIETHFPQVNLFIKQAITAGRDKEELKFCLEALEVVKKYFGPDHIYSAYFLLHIATLEKNQMHFTKSLQIIKVLFTKCKTEKEDREHLLNIYIPCLFSGEVLQSYAKPAETIKQKQEILEKLRNKFGGNNKNVLSFQSSLASSMVLHGKHTEGIRLSEDLITKYAQILGVSDSKDLKVLKTLSNIACSHLNQGHYDKALAIFEDIYEKLNTPEEAEKTFFASVCQLMGQTLIKLGKYDKALTILQSSYEKIAAILGKNHIDSLSHLSHIGDALIGLGRFEEALHHHERNLQARLALSGRDSLHAKKNVAIALSHLSRHEEAFAYFSENERKILTFEGYKLNIIEIAEGFALAIEKSGKNLGLACDILFKVKDHLPEAFETESPRAQEFLENAERIQNKFLGTFPQKEFNLALNYYKEGNLEKAFERCNNLYQEMIAQRWKEDVAMFANFCSEMAKILLNLVQTKDNDFAKFLEENEDNFSKIKNLGGYCLRHGSEENSQRDGKYIRDSFGDTAVHALDFARSGCYSLSGKAIKKLFYERNYWQDKYLEDVAEMVNTGDLQGALKILNFLKNEIKSMYGEQASSELVKISLEIQSIQVKQRFEQQYDGFRKGSAFIEKGNFEKALKIFLKVYQELGPFWKENAGLFSNVCINLGFILNELGRPKEALDVLSGNIAKVKEQLGQGASLYFVMKNMANSYRATGDVYKAMEIHKEVLIDMQNQFGKQHKNVLLVKAELAMDLSHLRQHEEACYDLLEVLQKLDDVTSLDSIQIQNYYVEAMLRSELQSRERIEDALAMLQSTQALMLDDYDTEGFLFRKVLQNIELLKSKLDPVTNEDQSGAEADIV